LSRNNLPVQEYDLLILRFSRSWISVQAETLKGIIKKGLSHRDIDAPVMHPIVKLDHPPLVVAKIRMGPNLKLHHHLPSDI
jgi:hypothetical protein